MITQHESAAPHFVFFQDSVSEGEGTKGINREDRSAADTARNVA
jgi:hypothetical protein